MIIYYWGSPFHFYLFTFEQFSLSLSDLLTRWPHTYNRVLLPKERKESERKVLKSSDRARPHTWVSVCVCLWELKRWLVVKWKFRQFPFAKHTVSEWLLSWFLKQHAYIHTNITHIFMFKTHTHRYCTWTSSTFQRKLLWIPPTIPYYD